VIRVQSDAATEQLNRFPGYPEMIWNAKTRKFEYAE
jgi:hypothetical protein